MEAVIWLGVADVENIAAKLRSNPNCGLPNTTSHAGLLHATAFGYQYCCIRVCPARTEICSNFRAVVTQTILL